MGSKINYNLNDKSWLLPILVQHILESKLLLDEDLEIVNEYNNFNFDDYNNGKSNHFIYLLITALLLAANLVLLQFFTSPVLVALTVILISIFLYNIREYMTRRAPERDLKDLITNIMSINKLNRLILEYYYCRKRFSLQLDNIEPYSKKVQTFATFICECEKRLIVCLMNSIQHVCKLVPSIGEQYIYITTIDLRQFDIELLRDIDSLIDFNKKLSDTLLLLSSTFLSTVALAFCPSLWKNIPINHRTLWGQILPTVKEQTYLCSNNLQHTYTEMQLSIKRMKPPEIQSKSVINLNNFNLEPVILRTSSTLDACLDSLKSLLKSKDHSSSSIEIIKNLTDIRTVIADYQEYLSVVIGQFELKTMNTEKDNVEGEKVPEKVEQEEQPEKVAAEELPAPQTGTLMYAPEEEYAGSAQGDMAEEAGCSYTDTAQVDRKQAAVLTADLQNKLKDNDIFKQARKRRYGRDVPMPQPIRIPAPFIIEPSSPDDQPCGMRIQGVMIQAHAQVLQESPNCPPGLFPLRISNRRPSFQLFADDAVGLVNMPPSQGSSSEQDSNTESGTPAKVRPGIEAGELASKLKQVQSERKPPTEIIGDLSSSSNDDDDDDNDEEI